MNTYRDPDFDGFGPLEGLEHLGRHITDADGQPSGSPANFEYLRGARHPDGHIAARAAASADTLAALRREFANVGSFAAAQEREEVPAEVEGDRPIMIRRTTLPPAEPDAPAERPARRRSRAKATDESGENAP